MTTDLPTIVVTHISDISGYHVSIAFHTEPQHSQGLHIRPGYIAWCSAFGRTGETPYSHIHDACHLVALFIVNVIQQREMDRRKI